MSEREERVQCYLRRALIYSEDMDENKDREIIVIENLKEAINLLNRDDSCNSCNCECMDIFKKKN